jgi:glucan biosynthesis protein C
MPATHRRHDIDALRVLAFGLLVLYHVGLVYVADWDYHIKSAHQTAWLEVPMTLLNRWRMPLLFLLSGIALGLARPWSTPWRAFGQRSRRLLLPLVVGMLLVVPVQPYIEALRGSHVPPGYFDFLGLYFGGHPWPEDAFGGAAYGITWNHLWFLPYAWLYGALALAVAFVWRSRVGHAAIAAVHRMPLPVLWLGLALPAALAMNLLADAWPDRKDFFPDLYNHSHYGAVFLFGLLLGSGDGVWETLRRARWWSLGVSVVLALAYFPWLFAVDDRLPPWEVWSLRSLRAGYMAAVLLALLGWARHALDRRWPGLAYANEAVLPWYVFHQSLIVPLAWWAAQRGLGPLADVAVVLGGTVFGCLLLHEFAVRRWAPMRWVFGLPHRRGGRSDASRG